MPKFTVSFDLMSYTWEVEAENEDEAVAQAAKEYEDYIDQYGLQEIATGYCVAEVS